jgi:hypothetical protein
MLNLFSDFNAAVQLDRFISCLLRKPKKKDIGVWDIVRYTCQPEEKSFVSLVKRHREFKEYTPWFNLHRRAWDHKPQYPFIRALRNYPPSSRIGRPYTTTPSKTTLWRRRKQQPEEPQGAPNWTIEVLDTCRSLKLARAMKTAYIYELMTVEPYGYNQKDGKYTTISEALLKVETAWKTRDKLPREVHKKVLELARLQMGTPTISKLLGIKRETVSRILRKYRIPANGRSGKYPLRTLLLKQHAQDPKTVVPATLNSKKSDHARN